MWGELVKFKKRKHGSLFSQHYNLAYAQWGKQSICNRRPYKKCLIGEGKKKSGVQWIQPIQDVANTPRSL